MYDLQFRNCSPANGCRSDESTPAPPKVNEGAQDAELAEVIEKSKTEVSGPNGDSEAPDTEMADASAAQDTETPAATDAKPTEEVPVKDDQQPAKPKEQDESGKADDSDEPGNPAEPQVELGSKEGLSPVENAASKESEPSNGPSEVKANGVLPSEAKSEDATKNATNGDTAVEEHAPDHDTPSSILEKGTPEKIIPGRYTGLRTALKDI